MRVVDNDLSDLYTTDIGVRTRGNVNKINILLVSKRKIVTTWWTQEFEQKIKQNKMWKNQSVNRNLIGIAISTARNHNWTWSTWFLLRRIWLDEKSGLITNLSGFVHLKCNKNDYNNMKSFAFLRNLFTTTDTCYVPKNYLLSSRKCIILIMTTFKHDTSFRTVVCVMIKHHILRETGKQLAIISFCKGKI